MQSLRANLFAYLSFQSLPERERKGANFRHTVRKGARDQHLADPAASEHAVAALAKVRGLAARERVPLGNTMAGCELRDFGHKTAATDPAIDEALGVKLRVSRFDRVA
ncbi:hypothetical protein D3C87_1252710 [compost metagenome]